MTMTRATTITCAAVTRMWCPLMSTLVGIVVGRRGASSSPGSSRHQNSSRESFQSRRRRTLRQRPTTREEVSGSAAAATGGRDCFLATATPPQSPQCTSDSRSTTSRNRVVPGPPTPTILGMRGFRIRLFIVKYNAFEKRMAAEGLSLVAAARSYFLVFSARGHGLEKRDAHFTASAVEKEAPF
jgi:hypothetical protein